MPNKYYQDKLNI